MRLEIRSTNIHFGESVRNYIARRMQSAVGPFTGRIGPTTVCLADVNGPHGGKDKQCRIAIRLHRGRTICVKDADADLIRVINRAADRVRQALAKDIERRRNRRRGFRSWKPVSG